MADDDADDLKAFSCRIENVKSITDILNCLCIDMTKGQHCHVEATPASKLLLYDYFASAVDLTAACKPYLKIIILFLFFS